MHVKVLPVLCIGFIGMCILILLYCYILGSFFHVRGTFSSMVELNKVIHRSHKRTVLVLIYVHPPLTQIILKHVQCNCDTCT